MAADHNYPYTLMDENQMDGSKQYVPQNRQQPPPYNGYNAPESSMSTPPAVAPMAPAPPVMAPVITVNNMGAPTSSDAPGNVAVGREAVIMTCPHCRCRNKTRTKGRATVKTHLACLLLSCTGLCCLPYCMTSCRNVDHFCTVCSAYLGSYVS